MDDPSKTTLRTKIVFYRGYTHGEFSFMPESPLAFQIGQWLRQNLTEREFIPEGYRWDKNIKKRVYCSSHWETTRIYCFYDTKTNRLKVPIAFAKDIINLINDWGGIVEEKSLPDYPLRKINLSMNKSFSDRPWQIDLIKKCSDPTPGMKGLSMQCGRGKTYSATKAMINLGYAGIVIVAGLMDQWIASILETTNATKEDLYKIEGFQSLGLLAQHPEFKPAVFIGSLRTMQIFQKGGNDYDLLPWTYAGFFREYGIGVKIVDECHLNFHANTMMDLETNVPYNMYCSATFTQNGKDARRIFERIFPEEIQYGMDNFDKYTTCIALNYWGEVQEKYCVKSRGYMHTKYEQNIMISEQKFRHHVECVLVPLINQYFVETYKPGFKLLIICASINFAESLESKLKKIYPKFKVGTYLGGDERSELKKLDMVISTPGKSGTGLDLKGLSTVIGTVSVASPPLVEQIFGRLRRIDGENVVYVDLCDMNIPAQIRHAEQRRRIYRRIAAKYYEFNGLNDTHAYYN